jgi:CheY-like chemotaxis protein
MSEPVPARPTPATSVPPPLEPGHARQAWAEAPAGGGAADRAILATLRHDLRTPINAILGYGELLLEDEEARESDRDLVPDLRRIHEAGVALLQRVNQVLNPARLEVAVQADLEHLGAELRRDLRTPIVAIIGFGETLLAAAAAAHRDEIVPDLAKIGQAAAQFLALIDDGVIFSASTHDMGRAKHGTDLQIGGRGTADLVQEAFSSLRALEGKARAATAEPGNVLIVDDQQINLEVLTRHLERQGHTVTARAHGQAALETLQVQSFDLVLLDIMMPEVNGYAVLQQLKDDPATRDIPVIMISALDELDAAVQCIEMGAADYLTKPFNATLLRARTVACLEQKRLRDQEKDYLRRVAEVTAAAAAVESNSFDPQILADAVRRADALGQLARVFQRMATEIHAREQRLKQEVQQLRVEIDQVKLAHQVAEITDTDFFQDLQRKARHLRPDRPAGT